MLLAARDQENAVLQAPTQNGKQQKLQGFPKTPGLKKLHQQDENLGTIKKGGKAAFASSAFVTPAGPRNRVVLGGKDTNFKTRRKSPEDGGGGMLKKPAVTPGPSKLSLKQTTAAAPAIKPSDDDDYPEIEYMPPKPIDLPDLPDDFTPVNVDLIRKNMYKDIFRDQFDEYARIATEGLHSTEDEDRMFAESEADARRVLMREERRDTVRAATRGKKAGMKKSAAAAAAADKENKGQGGGAALKQKNTFGSAKTMTTNNATALGKSKQPAPLQGRTYSTGTVSSLHRRLPSRPTSAQATSAARMLSQQSATKPRAPSATTHNRAASSAGILSKVTGAVTGYSAAASRPKSAAATRPKVDPRVAEMNSKTSIGYSGGRPLAASVQRALLKGKDDLDFSSSDEEEDIDDGQGDVKDSFDDLFMAYGVDINRIDEADEDFELVL